MSPNEHGIHWEQLLADYLAERPGAASQLVRTASPVVLRAVRSLLTGPDGDDAVQEALLDILHKAHTVREPAAFPSWISVVAKNAARRVRRQRKRILIPVDVATLAKHATVDSIDTGAIASRIDASGVLSALETLTSRERDVVLLLATQDGHSYGDVSQKLGCPVGSLGPTRQRALSKLRRHSAVLAAV
jgi:RNA polymerase sigma factor (sigma-70 family)